jgi:hypothetical protein
MFKLIRVFPRHASPCVGGYVEFDRRYIVGEFIKEALENYPAISGYFSIDGTSLEARYGKGKLIDKEFPEDTLNAKIAAVSFYTGWNKADYVITKIEGQ